MFCGECGTQNPDTNSFCKNCGKPLRKTGQNAPELQAPAAPGIPVPATPGVAGQPAAGEIKPPRNWLAIVSLVLSVIAWLIYPVLIGAGAIILGIIALAVAKKSKTKIPVTAVLAIIIGILAIIINLFWLDIFPAPAVLPPIK